MEITYHVSVSIKLKITTDGTNDEMCNELIYKDGKDKGYYATTTYNIMSI